MDESGACGGLPNDIPSERRRLCPYAEQAAERAVRKVFAVLGVDIDKPDQVEEFREDLRFGRNLRRDAKHGRLAIVGVICAAIMLAVWYGIKASLSWQVPG